MYSDVTESEVCWKLQNFKDQYLEAEVVEEIMGWLRVSRPATSNKIVT